MWRTLTCSNWGAILPTQCVLFARARTHACLQMLSRGTSGSNVASTRVDDDDDRHTWPGDADFLYAPDEHDIPPNTQTATIIFVAMDGRVFLIVTWPAYCHVFSLFHLVVQRAQVSAASMWQSISPSSSFLPFVASWSYLYRVFHSWSVLVVQVICQGSGVLLLESFGFIFPLLVLSVSFGFFVSSVFWRVRLSCGWSILL